MAEAFICDYIRTPIGRFGGSLSSVRTDDLGAVPLKALMERNGGVDWAAVDDVVYGCANQAGEDNRNVARMALLLAGLPKEVPGSTVNRFCGSGMDAVTFAARAIKAGEAELMIAGGVESMSRAPFVLPKADAAFSRNAEIYDSTIGWRFVNPRYSDKYSTEGMGETAENVAARFKVTREDQDAFALQSHRRWAAAQEAGRFADELVPVGEVDRDEHPRSDTSLEKLSTLKPVFREGGTITAGNASGINDGAAALVIASEEKARELGVEPLGRFVASAVAGVDPRYMGVGPVPAVQKLLARAGIEAADLDLVELNEAFASQSLQVIRELGLDPERVNVNGGAIALGHPLGMSGARLVVSLLHELRRREGRYGLATLCVGVGQGQAAIFERDGGN
jgi:acetyl-CoA acyltransferase